MDGNVARARRWSCEKFQHNSVSKRLVKKNEGEGSFYTSRGKRKGLDQCQVLDCELESTNL
jgi:hypothetical protein